MTGVFDDHLSLDAVVAYADGEMGLTAYQRAAAHLSHCGACAADVGEQTAASAYLRDARLPAMPGSLFDALKSIPIAVPAPAGDRGPHVVAGGPEPSGWTRRFRWGAGALVAGIAVGAVMAGAAGDQSPGSGSGNGSVPGTSAVSDPGAPGSPPSGPTAAVRTTVIDVLARSSSSSGPTR